MTTKVTDRSKRSSKTKRDKPISNLKQMAKLTEKWRQEDKYRRRSPSEISQDGVDDDAPAILAESSQIKPLFPLTDEEKTAMIYLDWKNYDQLNKKWVKPPKHKLTPLKWKGSNPLKASHS